MLELSNITKDYKSGDTTVHALKGINLCFRKSEFVSILGPSGCGKTTMLNIIGGLDHYTDGDLFINGISTKKYNDRDWDTYRNHSIGFVFQSYNLIPHQSVLANVELALTLTGVGKAERRQRAIDALTKVGLKDHINKRPNQLSGGQMQRVAIARAIVNDPDILLADEPTGALDTNTSIQIMELLKDIAKDRLIIMVTHNPELAKQYSTRIIKLLDGNVIDDTMPYEAEAVEEKKEKKKRLSSMSLMTAFSLSMKNLLTKKGRTFLAAFAGSIGIIGIALILSLSNGIQEYINKVEEDTLSAYPITIEEKTMDMTGLMEIMAGDNKIEEHKKDKVYSQNMMGKVLSSLVSEVQTNNLKDFKTWLDTNDEVQAATSDIMYSYGTTLDIYLQGDDKNIQVNPFDMWQFYGMSSSDASESSVMSSYNSMFGNSMMSETWAQMPDNEEMMKSQFEVIAGEWADDYDECMLVVDENNEIYDLTLYALGLEDSSQLETLMADALKSADEGTDIDIDTESKSFDYDDILGLSYKLVLPTDCYEHNEKTGTWDYMGDNEEYMKDVIENSMDIKISGIIRVKEDAMSTSVKSGTIAYTKALTERFIEEVNASDIVKEQKADKTKDVFTGLPFSDGTEVNYSNEEKASMIMNYFSGLTSMEKSSTYLDIMSTPSDETVNAAYEQMNAQCPDRASKIAFMQQAMEQSGEEGMDMQTMSSYFDNMSDEDIDSAFKKMAEEITKANVSSQAQQQFSQLTTDQAAAGFDSYLAGLSVDEQAELFDSYMPATVSESTYDDNINKLNSVNLDEPKSIDIYANSFENKDKLKDLIDEYNKGVEKEEDEITYTDLVGMMMSSLSQMVDIVSYVLIAFVAISLIVSSIMIAIITYISVLERTKEIGILRSVGASKKDVSHVFTAETVIEGLVSGLIGIGITLILNIPINIVVKKLTDVSGISKLPVAGAVILIIISVLLTLIAGFFPSRMAAKRDPVEALRSE